MHFILWTITLLRQGSFDAYMSDHPRLPTFGHWLSHCHFRQKDKKNCINWEASSWEVRASVLSAGYCGTKNLILSVVTRRPSCCWVYFLDSMKVLSRFYKSTGTSIFRQALFYSCTSGYYQNNPGQLGRGVIFLDNQLTTWSKGNCPSWWRNNNFGCVNNNSLLSVFGEI